MELPGFRVERKIASQIPKYSVNYRKRSLRPIDDDINRGLEGSIDEWLVHCVGMLEPQAFLIKGLNMDFFGLILSEFQLLGQQLERSWRHTGKN